jgi:hypothetical protein
VGVCMLWPHVAGNDIMGELEKNGYIMDACMYVVEVGECGGAGGVAFSIAGAVLNGRRG